MPSGAEKLAILYLNAQCWGQAAMQIPWKSTESAHAEWRLQLFCSVLSHWSYVICILHHRGNEDSKQPCHMPTIGRKRWQNRKQMFQLAHLQAFLICLLGLLGTELVQQARFLLISDNLVKEVIPVKHLIFRWLLWINALGITASNKTSWSRSYFNSYEFSAQAHKLLLQHCSDSKLTYSWWWNCRWKL